MSESPSLFNKRTAYKPFWFGWAYEAFKISEQMHWLASEVALNDDVKQWKTQLSADEKALLTQIFRFFTQADIDVASGYIERYLPLFKPTEIRMAMTSIAAREAVHIEAYSALIDEVGMPETEYSAFLEYAEMKDKHEYLFQERDGVEGLAQDIAVFSAFGEGLQLFASFVMLLNFTRFGKMTGMGQMIAWSIRDESHHVDFMMQVFHQFIKEHPQVWTDAFKKKLYQTARDMVALEDRFIDLAFSFAPGGIEGLTAQDVKQYIRFIADKRLLQLGLKPNYGVTKNPLPWVDKIVNGKEHTNFFENRATDYGKGAIEGSWDDAFGESEPIPAPATVAVDHGGLDDPIAIRFSTPEVYTVVTKDACPFCTRAKALLTSLKLDFREIKLETLDEDDRQSLRQKGLRTVPQIWFGDEHIGGYDNLAARLGRK